MRHSRVYRYFKSGGEMGLVDRADSERKRIKEETLGFKAHVIVVKWASSPTHDFGDDCWRCMVYGSEKDRNEHYERLSKNPDVIFLRKFSEWAE